MIMKEYKTLHRSPELELICLFVWVYGLSTLQINSSVSNNSVLHNYSFNVKTVPIQTIQFSISTQFKCQNSSI